MLSKLKSFDWALYALIFILVSISIVLIYSISYVGPSNLAYKQAMFVLIGFVGMFGLSFVDYRIFKNWSAPLYLIGVAVLFAVLVFGTAQFGASRWIDLGFFDFQPSEIFKLLIIIVMAKFFSLRLGHSNVKNLINAFILALIPIALVMKQPDLGTAIVIGVVSIGLVFAIKLPRKTCALIVACLILAMPVGFFSLKDYQKQRLETFLNPNSDPSGAGYNILQAKIAVGSGGLLGKGLGKGSQSELNFLPVAHTDFIFAGLAEVAGFVGSLIVIMLFMLVLWRVINIANRSQDDFGSLLALGFAILILFQVFVNIGMNIGIMPVVGIPLPFISYGGNSLITNLIGVGIIQSICRYNNINKKY